MAIPRFRKNLFLIYLLCFIACLSAVYLRRVPHAGYVFQQSYFDGQGDTQPQGAATSPFDLPVYIVTGQMISPQPSQSNQPKSTSSYRLPTDLRCTADADLCEKIKFSGAFSDADKRKYQSLIIRQIKSIDSILGTDMKIKDTLFSLTLDKAKGSRRGWAGNATIMINLGNINTQEEFIEILTHELGHIVDLGILQGNKRILQNAFSNIDHTFFAASDPSLRFYTISRLSNTTRKTDASSLGFVGGYAMNDPFEDFAETFNMYLNHHNVLAILSTENSELKKKYLFMQGLFEKRYLKADIATATTIQDNMETRPWDTTKGY